MDIGAVDKIPNNLATVINIEWSGPVDLSTRIIDVGDYSAAVKESVSRIA